MGEVALPHDWGSASLVGYAMKLKCSKFFTQEYPTCLMELQKWGVQI